MCSSAFRNSMSLPSQSFNNHSLFCSCRRAVLQQFKLIVQTKHLLPPRRQTRGGSSSPDSAILLVIVCLIMNLSCGRPSVTLPQHVDPSILLPPDAGWTDWFPENQCPKNLGQPQTSPHSRQTNHARCFRQNTNNINKRSRKCCWRPGVDAGQETQASKMCAGYFSGIQKAKTMPKSTVHSTRGRPPRCQSKTETQQLL